MSLKVNFFLAIFGRSGVSKSLRLNTGVVFPSGVGVAGVFGVELPSDTFSGTFAFRVTRVEGVVSFAFCQSKFESDC